MLGVRFFVCTLHTIELPYSIQEMCCKENTWLGSLGKIKPLIYNQTNTPLYQKDYPGIAARMKAAQPW